MASTTTTGRQCRNESLRISQARVEEMINPVTTKRVTEWAPVMGIWEQDLDSLVYAGPEQSAEYLTSTAVPGIALCGVRFSNGKVKAAISLPQQPRDRYGQILLGFSSWESRCISVGISGIGPAFVVVEHVPGIGWRTLKGTGSAVNLKGDHRYQIEVGVDGQRVTLIVDGIKVLDHILSGPLSREQVGLYSQGQGPVKFDSVEVLTQAYSAFVVMQFTEPFNDLYDEVIRPVCEGLEIDAYRASDIYRPGVIFQDILQGLDESNVVIADVTPPNPNVFYELGYSHALKKPVVLLAERNTPLPFDISGYRVIFYDNTIGGKSAVEADLRRHLTSILGD